MDQEQARREVRALTTDSLTSLAAFYGPGTAAILRALADMIEETEKPKRLN
jgi:hypothetical protein